MLSSLAMNPLTLALGVLSCCYGGYVLTLRLRGHDEKFRKLGPMREFWGPKLGSGIHYFGYAVMPLIFGLALIWAGYQGIGIF